MHATHTVDDVLSSLGTTREGLSDAEISDRHTKYGFNELPEKKRSLLLLFLRQFNSILVYILFAALALSILLPLFENGHALKFSDFLDAIAIGAILILNACLGFYQERKAENAIASLKALSEPNVRVKRGGKVIIIPSRELVPGDILLLEEGDKISADGRVIFARGAKVNEASLTGESLPEIKKTDPLEGEPVLADQKNMVFRGTVVTAGRMEVCVTEIGLETELGKVAKLVSSVEHPPTPLEKSMSALGRWLGIVVIVFCSLIFAVGFLRGLHISEMLLAAASLAVSAVPEGLPAIVTVCLAIGVQRMIARRALTRELSAIETLGSVTVICTDKTGTITENRMEVEDVWRMRGGEDLEDEKNFIYQIAASCNNALSLEVGDPTEVGLLKKAQEKGVERLSIIEEDVPFSSETKYMMTTHERMRGDRGGEEERIQFIKGAPEVIVEMCDLSDDEKEEVLEENEEMAEKALRVLGFAWKKSSEEKAHFVGLIGLMDPPRDGVKDAIKVAKKAGIRTVMITGDHALTAQAIAKKVGLESDVILGKDLPAMSDEELQKCVHEHSIFARVSPAQKVRILTGLQNSGEIVAMGGDGVNDAPALKKAHVGFAMGKQGTDVARETAEMILTDDHYASVVSAVEEGRTIYDNIRKFVVFLLRANFDELMVVLGAILIGVPLPYLPIHILLVNLVTDSLPAMALAVEKPEKNVMRRPPRKPGEHILHGEVFFIALAAVIATVASFHVFYVGGGFNGSNVDLGRTMVVTTSILFELTLVFTCRSKQSLLKIGAFSNRYLLGAVGIAFAIFLACIYSPLNTFLHLVPLRIDQWILPVVWSTGALMFFEGLKVMRWKNG